MNPISSSANYHFIISELKTWGWITLIIGVVELFAGFSLFAGGEYGRWIGIIVAALAAINALFDITAQPIWALCVFILALVILYELAKAPAARTQA